MKKKFPIALNLHFEVNSKILLNTPYFLIGDKNV